MSAQKLEDLREITETCLKLAKEIWRKNVGSPETPTQWEKEKDFVNRVAPVLLEHCLKTGIRAEKSSPLEDKLKID